MQLKAFIIGCFIFVALKANAQDTTAYKLIGAGFGLNMTKTDLSEQFKKPTIDFSAFLQFAKQKRINGALYLTFGQVVSENRSAKFIDQSEFSVNSFASTDYQSLHFELILNIIRRPQWSISLAQGFGFMRYNVFDANNNSLTDQLNTRATGESYSGFCVLLPTSISAQYLFKNNFGLKFKAQLYNPMTDYLDNISSFGNPDNNDNIVNYQLSVFKRCVF